MLNIHLHKSYIFLLLFTWFAQPYIPQLTPSSAEKILIQYRKKSSDGLQKKSVVTIADHKSCAELVDDSSTKISFSESDFLHLFHINCSSGLTCDPGTLI